jgi:hypothetical protein
MNEKRPQATCYLATVTGRADKIERFSFTNLHMHHYWKCGWVRMQAKRLAIWL